jgi:hypothetical protein
MKQTSTRPFAVDERFNPDTWPVAQEQHMRPPHVSMYAKLRDANKQETRASIWRGRLSRKLSRQDRRRDQASLDKFVGEDPLWKGLVADQQFANREAQMYGIVAIWEAQNRTNELLTEIKDLLAMAYKIS